jgi:hypothetical protein
MPPVGYLIRNSSCLTGTLDLSYATIDTDSIITSDSRTIGTEHIALTQLKDLKFFSILEECSFSEREQNYAAVQICARMVHPASSVRTPDGCAVTAH